MEIRIDQIEKKRNKRPGLNGIVMEMLAALDDLGIDKNYAHNKNTTMVKYRKIPVDQFHSLMSSRATYTIRILKRANAEKN